LNILFPTDYYEWISANEIVNFSKSTLLAVNQDHKQTPNVRGDDSERNLGTSYLTSPDISAIRLALHPTRKTPKFLAQKSVSSAVMVGGVFFLSKGIEHWIQASKARTDEDFKIDRDAGDQLATGGFYTFLVGVGGMWYYVKKGKTLSSQ
jgi:hypothetical protein